MKLFIPFTINDIGGTATFVEKFSRKLTENGIEVTTSFDWSFDILFIIADCPLLYPLLAKLLRKKIIQRLDGVYHPATPAGYLYPLYNIKMKIIHNWLADTVVYQSEFSKESCEKFLGKTHAKKTAIIYNGVEVPDVTDRRRERNSGNPVRLVTFSKFRRSDQIEPLIESVRHLDAGKFTFDIYGSYTDNLADIFSCLPSTPNIRFLGKVPNSDLLKKIGDYDIFLFSDQSACPNSVIEALMAGLPVAAFSRGSINELIDSGYTGKVVSIRENTDPFKDTNPFGIAEYTAFSQSISEIAEDLDRYAENAKDTALSRFKISQMVLKYGEILNN